MIKEEEKDMEAGMMLKIEIGDKIEKAGGEEKISIIREEGLEVNQEKEGIKEEEEEGKGREG